MSSCVNSEGWLIDTDAGASDNVSILVDSATTAKLIRPWAVALTCGFDADIPSGTREGSNNLKKANTKEEYCYFRTSLERILGPLGRTRNL
jgi:hypothetical protein